MRTRMAEAATALALLLSGAFGVFQLWPKPGAVTDNGQLGLLALAFLAIGLGVLVLIAEVLAPPVGIIRGWRDRKARHASTSAPDRVVMRGLAEQGYNRLRAYRDLASGTPEADARSTALRVWLDRWERAVEDALAGDAPTLAAFTRPVDTSQMHFIVSPVHVLRVKLERLQPYVGGSFKLDAVIAPPLGVAPLPLDDPTQMRGVTGSPRRVTAADPGMAGAYADTGQKDNASLQALVEQRTNVAPPSVPAPNDDLQPAIATVDPRVRRTHEPPEGWEGHFWQGQQILKCPWDAYRTTDDQAFQSHRDTHTEPPTDTERRGVSVMPWPWARVPIHYLGDGSQYIGGVPADPHHTLYAAQQKADELIRTGLYGAGAVEGQVHAFSGAVGRTIVCNCAFEASTMAELQSHLAAAN